TDMEGSGRYGVETYVVGDERWNDVVDRIARRVGGTPASLPTGILSDIEESEEGFDRIAVLEATPERIRLARVFWPKPQLESWWRSIEPAAPWEVSPLPSVDLADSAPSFTACVDDTWASLDDKVPEARARHVAVWTGAEMIVWGITPDGWKYSPATDAWTRISKTGEPPIARAGTAVWTGTRMLVWGGMNPMGTAFVSQGGSYDPSTDTWSPISTSNAPALRQGHKVVWTGTRMIV